MDLLRLMIDFGLIVLIWIVQLIIYPSLKDIKTSRFNTWHRNYTTLISAIVFPLMISQLVLYVYLSIVIARIDMVISLIFVVMIWLHTFLVAVPIHQRLHRDGNLESQCKHLTRTNWWRTAGWTLVWLISVLSSL